MSATTNTLPTLASDVNPITTPTAAAAGAAATTSPLCLSHHHEKLLDAYDAHILRWQQVTRASSVVEGGGGGGGGGNTKTEQGRCPVCWLRSYDCYCSLEQEQIATRRQIYEALDTVISLHP